MFILESVRRIVLVFGHDSHSFGRLFEMFGKQTHLFPVQEIFVQHGATEYDFNYSAKTDRYESKDFVKADVLLRHINEADLVVCHAGGGILRDALLARKPCLVLPRLRVFREHINNHQLEIFDEFINSRLIMNLEDAVSWSDIDGLRKRLEQISIRCLENFAVHITE